MHWNVLESTTLNFLEFSVTETINNVFSGDTAMDAPAELLADPTHVESRQRLATNLVAAHEARLSNAPNRAATIEKALAEARANSRSADMEADIEYLAALDAISRGDLDASREMLDRGRELCAKGTFGPVRLALARLGLALSVT
jgi:hypothetical protein